MKSKDKQLLVIMVILLFLLLIKSFLLDDYKSKSDDEIIFKEKVEKIVEDKYDSSIYENNIIVIRIIKISEMSEKERTIIDSEGNKFIATGVYKAKIRKYILGILPFSEETILDID